MGCQPGRRPSLGEWETFSPRSFRTRSSRQTRIKNFKRVDEAVPVRFRPLVPAEVDTICGGWNALSNDGSQVRFRLGDAEKSRLEFRVRKSSNRNNSVSTVSMLNGVSIILRGGGCNSSLLRSLPSLARFFPFLFLFIETSFPFVVLSPLLPSIFSFPFLFLHSIALVVARLSKQLS